MLSVVFGVLSTETILKPTNFLRQFLVCLAAVVAFSGEARRVLVRRTPTYAQPTQTSSLSTGDSSFSLENLHDDLPVVKTALSFEKFDHHRAFLGPAVAELLGDAELTQDEMVVLAGSGFSTLMEASLDQTYDTGMQGFRAVALSMIDASRKVLENRVANGIAVSEEQFENVDEVRERMSAVLDAIAATFDQKQETVYSLVRFFKDFEFDPVERVKYMARVVPTISRAVFQIDDTTTAEKLRDAYNIFLPATRKFIEEREQQGRPINKQRLEWMERSEKLMPPLMQAYVSVVHDPFLINFMQKLNIDIKERAKYLVSGFFTSMDAIFENPDASMAQMMRDVMLSYLQPTRQLLEDRKAEGKPVPQEYIDSIDRVEKTLPIILDTYVRIIEDLGIP